MNISAFFAQPGAPARAEFARACEVAVAFLWQIDTGRRPCPPEVAVRIERESNRSIMRWDLRKGDWHRIWPELIGAEGAPEVGAIPSNPQPPTPQREAA